MGGYSQVINTLRLFQRGWTPNSVMLASWAGLGQGLDTSSAQPQLRSPWARGADSASQRLA